MICQELDELCAKFGSLSPHLRIDYIYGMLRMCLPPELRFIGSVVEDLAKKDFNFLREHENRANNQTELKKYSSVDEKTLIEGMAINLSLLHSVNTACANIIFSLLEENLKRAFLISNTTDKKTIDIILLVLTMAKYHPAFTFHQRTTIAEYYKKVEQQLHNICAKPKTTDNNPPSPISPPTVCCSCSVATDTKVHNTPYTAIHQKAHIVHVSIDVKQEKSYRRYDRKHEYRIQVSWSNGQITETDKTYQELRDLYQNVCMQFPDEDDIVGHRTSFYLGNPQTDDVPDNVLQHTSALVRLLSSLPKPVKEWDQFVHFFDTDNSTGNRPLPPPPAPDSPSAYDDYQEGEMVECIPPVSSATYFGSSYRASYQSPQSSNHGSPINSRSASPGNQITSLLNKLQLMRYKHSLEKMSIDQLSSLSMDSLVLDYSINPDDAARIMAELEERYREKSSSHFPNGMMEPCIPGPMSHYPAWQYMHPPPRPVYQHRVMPFHFPTGVMANKDSSSSENSSPSRSPLPQQKPIQKGADSSSDDSEKGNRVDSPLLDGKKKVRHPSHNREEINRGTPPQTIPLAYENVHGHSGYLSDPTQGPFVKVIVANSSYIAQPTQTNFNAPSKSVINMPDSMAGRRIGLAFPYPRCDTQSLTTTVTSNSNNSGPELNRKPIIPGQIPFIRSPNVSGNDRSFMCSVTNSTTPVMATNLQSKANGNIRMTTMPPSEPPLSQSQNTDSQNGQVPSSTSSQQANGNSVTCSASNGHNSMSNSQYTSCDCTGGPPVPYQFHIPNQYITNQMFHIPPFMGTNPNGLVHHPFYHPHLQYPVTNGIHPGYLQAINPYSNITGAQYGCFPPVLQRRNSSGLGIGKSPRNTCSNCGSTDHISSECKENSMESMSASFHLKYDPKSNSD